MRTTQRGRMLVEESREIVVVLDAERPRGRREPARARGASTGSSRARRCRRTCSARLQRLEITYDVAGADETLVYLSEPGDLAAYEELRAGFTASVSHELRTPLARLLALLESARCRARTRPS